MTITVLFSEFLSDGTQSAKAKSTLKTIAEILQTEQLDFGHQLHIGTASATAFTVMGLSPDQEKLVLKVFENGKHLNDANIAGIIGENIHGQNAAPTISADAVRTNQTQAIKL